MSYHAHDQRRQALHHAQKAQRWGLFVLALLAVVGAKVLAQPSLAKGLIWGAMVAFVMQWLFATISFWRVRPHPKQMMNDMYFAMLARFGVGVVGFAIAFMWLKLNGLGVVIGFFVMWVWIVLTLAKVR